MASQPITRSYRAKIKAIGLDPLLNRIAEGQSIASIAKDIGVDRHVLSRFLQEPEHKVQFDIARRAAADYFAESIIDISDRSDVDTERSDKLRIEARRWLASKWDKEQYGEQQQAVNISIGGLLMDALRAPQQHVTQVTTAQQFALPVSRVREPLVLSTPCEQVTTTEASDSDSKQ